jgi:hypothetical protein
MTQYRLRRRRKTGAPTPARGRTGASLSLTCTRVSARRFQPLSTTSLRERHRVRSMAIEWDERESVTRHLLIPFRSVDIAVCVHRSQIFAPARHPHLLLFSLFCSNPVARLVHASRHLARLPPSSIVMLLFLTRVTTSGSSVKTRGRRTNSELTRTMPLRCRLAPRALPHPHIAVRDTC